MNCGLYIGCGTDFEPTLHLPHVKKFIFIDSQPLSSHGDLYQAFTPQDKLEFFSKSYMPKFSNAATEAGFQKISIDGVYPHVYKNFNTHQEVFHYYSMCVPIQSLNANVTANKDEILKLISSFNQVSHLIVRRYIPHYNIFRYFLRPIVFVAFDDTIYSENLNNLLPYEKKKISALLQQNQYRQYFSSYMYIQLKSNTHQIFQTYDEFENEIKK
jgi:hypothetical protein